MDEPQLLYRERRDDGRSIESTVTGGPDGIEITTTTRSGGEERQWGRTYTTAETIAVVAILGGDPDDLDDPAGFLHRRAADGDLPSDQTLDGWLADHGIVGTMTG